MIRVLVAGLFAALATIGGTRLGSPAAEPLARTETLSAAVTLPPIAVPVFREGIVIGYFLARLTVLGGESAFARLPVPPEALLADAVHAHVFANPALAFDRPEGLDLEAFRAELLASLKSRVGEAPDDIVVVQVDFLSKDDIRGNGLRRRAKPRAS